MKTLVSMTDFVISQIKTNSTVNDSFKKYLADVRNYALFLKQNLTLGMFVPVDEDGNILFSKPNYYACFLHGSYVNHPQLINYENCIRYKKAEENILFKDCIVKKIEKSHKFDIDYYVVYFNSQQLWISWTERTIEDLIKNNLELTESAIKQIFG